MKQFTWKNLNEDVRGILLIIFGIALLLHTAGIFQKLTGGVLLILSLLLIAQGAYELSLWERIGKIFKFKRR